MNFTRSERQTVGRLPLIGMIDVFFLLLVYFLVSASITPHEEELAAALGMDSQDASASNLEPQIIDIAPSTERGARFIVSGQQLSTQASLTDLLRRLPKEQGVFVRARDDAPVWAVAAALQAAEDAGFEKLTYVAPD
ncbi:MAG: ExbD/TolR family protein [Phycisphaerales bacterium]